VVRVEHHPQTASPAQARIVAQASAPVYVPSNDPARAYTVYPSTGAMARGSLLNIADQAVSRVVLGSVDRMMQPQAQGGNDMPQQAPQPSAAWCGSGGAAMPQQLPGGCRRECAGDAAPWNERNRRQRTPRILQRTGRRAPVQQIPAGDAAFVF
jgi:type IV secretion system protein VirB1